MRYFKMIFLMLMTAALITGCSQKSGDVQNTEMETLNIGVMPAVDAAPIFLAQEEGYFKELG